MVGVYHLAFEGGAGLGPVLQEELDDGGVPLWGRPHPPQDGVFVNAGAETRNFRDKVEQ